MAGFLRFLLIGAILVGNAGCAYLRYAKDPFTDIPNFAKVNDALYRGGAPNDNGLLRLKDLGVKSIISLTDDEEQLAKEKAFAEANGMKLYVIPMSVYERPTDEDVIKFLSIALDKNSQPVFVHCTSGRDRTGAMIAMYRIVVEGWPIKKAYNEAKAIGFWPYHDERAELKNFIHQMKDKPQYFEFAKRQMEDEKK